MAAPDLLDPKSAAQNSKPRLSFSAKPTVLASRVESDSAINVMKWKTVSTIFLVVVLYLIIGATVFKALEQPQEISQRTTIVIQKQTFIAQHACVNSTELDELIQVMAPVKWAPFVLKGKSRVGHQGGPPFQGSSSPPSPPSYHVLSRFFPRLPFPGLLLFLVLERTGAYAAVGADDGEAVARGEVERIGLIKQQSLLAEAMPIATTT